MTKKLTPARAARGRGDEGAQQRLPSTERSPRRQPQRPDPQIAACIALLAELFPRAFAVHEARRRPLKVGIRDDLAAALDGAVTTAELGLALRVYTSNPVYRSRLRAGAIRIDLNGEQAGHVTPEQQASPRTALDSIARGDEPRAATLSLHPRRSNDE